MKKQVSWTNKNICRLFDVFVACTPPRRQKIYSGKPNPSKVCILRNAVGDQHDVAVVIERPLSSAWTEEPGLSMHTSRLYMIIETYRSIAGTIPPCFLVRGREFLCQFGSRCLRRVTRPAEIPRRWLKARAHSFPSSVTKICSAWS